MEIIHLKGNEFAIPVIANWFYNEWGDHYPVKSVEYIAGLLKERMNEASLPLTLIAVENGEVIGTVNLKVRDMSIRQDLSPWLGGLYVREDARKKGVGTQLINAAVDHAKRLKFEQLYLWTATAKDYYLNLGWVLIEEPFYEGKNTGIFQKKIG